MKKIVSILSGTLVCILLLFPFKSASARKAYRPVHDICLQENPSLQEAKDAYIKSLDGIESSIEECCFPSCLLEFTQNQIDALITTVQLFPSIVGAVAETISVKVGASVAQSAMQLFGTGAKAKRSTEVRCSDDIRKKKMTQLKILRDRIQKLTQKELTTTCQEARSKGLLPKNAEEKFSIVAKFLRENITKDYPNILDELNSDCNQVSLEKAREPACISAIFRYCVGQDHRGGIAQEVPTHSILAVCLPKQNSIIQTVTATDLRNEVSACSEALVSHKIPCLTAARNICKNNGYPAGVIQEYYGDKIDIVCFSAQMQLVSFGVLTQQNPRCDSPSNIQHPFCVSAIHTYCSSLGFSGGIMQQQNENGSIAIACFAGKSHNIQFSERIPAYK